MKGQNGCSSEKINRKIIFRWWVAVALVMAAIFVGSSIPDEMKPPDPFSFADKLQHFIAYSLLGWAAYRALKATFPERSAAFHAVAAIGMASFYGITDETHQYFVPGRCTEFLDWTADTIGASVAVAITHLAGLKGGSNK